MTAPLLSIGTFGTHLIDCAGIWSFVGQVPSDIKQGGYKSEAEGITAFVDWFQDQDMDFQFEHVGNLRNDVFCLVMQ